MGKTRKLFDLGRWSELLGTTTTFYGCSWVEPQWEFDAPSVLYKPVFSYAIGGGNEVERMVEDWCIDFVIGLKPHLELSPSELKEFAWRRWSARNMKNRKAAWHTRVRVAWTVDEIQRPWFDTFDVVTQKGPFGE